MASVKDLSIGVFEGINYELKGLRESIENIHNYLVYLEKAGKARAIQAECKEKLGTLEWRVKDLVQEKKYYLEYFGFNKQDFKGKLYEGKPKYLNLDKEFILNEKGEKVYVFLPTEEKLEKGWKQILKEIDTDWAPEQKAIFESKMGLTVEQWRATQNFRF